jgi:hypothetical protein
MTKKSLWLLALVPVLALQTMPASACHVIGQRNGENICETTSDGAGQQYKPSSIQVTTSGPRKIAPAMQALELAERRSHHWH